jgi:hypothetical protein
MSANFVKKLSTTNHISISLTVFIYLWLGIATDYGLDDQGVRVRVPVGSRIFSSPQRPDGLWGPPSLLSNEYREALSPGIKRQVSEADHSPPASAWVKKDGSSSGGAYGLHFQGKVSEQASNNHSASAAVAVP